MKNLDYTDTRDEDGGKNERKHHREATRCTQEGGEITLPRVHLFILKG